MGIVDNAKIYPQKYHPRRALARLWRSGERAVDIWDNAEEALPQMPTARATTAPVSIYDLVHTGSNQPTDSADEAISLTAEGKARSPMCLANDLRRECQHRGAGQAGGRRRMSETGGKDVEDLGQLSIGELCELLEKIIREPQRRASILQTIRRRTSGSGRAQTRQSPTIQ